MISNYKLSKPCKVCGCEYQFQSRASCVKCHKERSKSYYQKTRKNVNPLLRFGFLKIRNTVNNTAERITR